MSYINRNRKNFRKVVYDLYKLTWVEEHISQKQKRDTLIDYYKGLEDNPSVYTFEDYIEEFGYLDGSLYAGEDEFIACEYQDKELILSLLENDEELCNLYLKDIDS